MPSNINDFFIKQFSILNPLLFVLIILSCGILTLDTYGSLNACAGGLAVGYLIGVITCGFNACFIKMSESDRPKMIR